ncbi:fructosamine kinase family protein [bacterium BMS3Abin03]|nr:fructosamine kinase family protein [bacterium BMS3Abin03]MCG6960158.1 fructosamine kinase family protein [bacterium BMS3Abin03]
MLNNKIKSKIENILGSQITKMNSLSGGCISSSYKVNTKDGNSYFLKYNYSSGSDMFLTEAHGLQELDKPGVITIPKVISFDKEFILLDLIESSSRSKNFSEDFGRKFAVLHKFNNEKYGFYEDNYIGSNPQLNIPDNDEEKNWTKFYFQKRILYQFHLAEKSGNSTSDLRSSISKLENKIDLIVTDNGEKPSLLHGDLWGGNYMVDKNGFACLIDPAVYYGNREADLAMTKLFGGFDSEFYRAYNEEFPLPDGYDYRENIYKLYHVLNHLNLFGSGYYSQAISLIKYYL